MTASRAALRVLLRDRSSESKGRLHFLHAQNITIAQSRLKMFDISF